MIISRTPFRLSFFGGGTDYPDWYNRKGGQVLATTIDKYCYITCRHLPPFFDYKIRVVYSQVENCQTPAEVQHPAVREVLQYLNIDRGVEIHHDGDLPSRCGLGTSSAFTVGLLHAMHALKGQISSKQQLASESIHIEQECIKETVGSQDQVLAAYGGFNHITFPSEGDISVSPTTLSKDRINELNDHLMLTYTGIRRLASDVAQTFVQDIPAKERQLESMKDMVQEGISILNNGEDISHFGELLHRAWRAKREVSSAVSNPQVDEIYDNARTAGAVGGKLVGAGGGGFMLLFAPPDKQAKIKERLNGLIHVPFRFESSGSQIIFLDHEQDYRDAELDRDSQPIERFSELNRSEIGAEDAH